MISLLLDTHILVWYLTAPRQLREHQLNVLRAAERRGEKLAISSMSLWEIAMLARRDRLQVHRPVGDWLREIENSPGITVLPITAQVALESVRFLDPFPKDPIDRIITATAFCHGLGLVTSDERIRRSASVPVI